MLRERLALILLTKCADPRLQELTLTEVEMSPDLKQARVFYVARENLDRDQVQIALDKALPEIRDAIHLGDLLTLSLPHRFDLVLGLDVFEHLNPNKLDAYLSTIAGLVEDGGAVFTNIPAFGHDPAFGEVFRRDYPVWDEDAAEGRLFRAVPVDDYGYPKNGHLINAESDWWTRAFERHGFRRRIDYEADLHRAYDAAIDRIAPARRSFFVFSKAPAPARADGRER